MTEQTGATFTLPDSLTIRQQLKIKQQLLQNFNDGQTLATWWEIGKGLFTDWKSELVPDPAAVDLDAETDPRVANIVMDAAFAVSNWFAGLGNVEKK